MARVTGKYDVGFERGEGGFKSVFGTLVGTLLKENKEKYARELKAADPKNAYSILSDLMKERRQLVQQMGRAQRDSIKTSASSGPRTRVETTTGGSSADRERLRRDFLLRNRDNAQEITKGLTLWGTETIQNAYRTAIDRVRKSTDPIDQRQHIRRLIASLAEGSEIGSGPKLLGVAHRMFEAIRDSDLPYDTKLVALRELSNRSGYVQTKDAQSVNIIDGKVVAGLTLQDLKDIAGTAGGGKKKKVTTDFGREATIDPEQITAAYKPTLDALDAQIKKAREDYETAKREYKGIIKGPGYNMALAPLSSRPSALSQSLSKYGRLREVDPSYTRESMAASEEEGKFVLPTPYEDLVSIEGAGGKSPINLLLSTTDNLRSLRGLGYEGEVRSLAKEEADLAEGSLSQMLESLNSPLYKGADYDGVREVLERHQKGFEATKDNPAQRIMVANSLADQMSIWEGSLDQDRIIEMSKKDNPASRVADSIRQSQAAYDRFLQTRDTEQYRAEISQTYNDLLNTPADQRGLVGDAYLNEVERYESVDPSRRLPEELNFKLQGLAQSADEIAARNVLTPGYTGDLPPLGDPRIGRPKPLGGTVERDPDELVTEEEQRAETT